MPKRVAGGYLLSSDDSCDELDHQPLPKKAKPLRPPRLPASAPSEGPQKKLPKLNFPIQPPKAATSQPSRSTLDRPEPRNTTQRASALVSTLRGTSTASKDVDPLSNVKAPAPRASLAANGKKRALTPVESGDETNSDKNTGVCASSGSSTRSSWQILEQRMSHMSNKLEELKVQSEQNQRETRQLLTALIESQANVHALLTALTQGLKPANPIEAEPPEPVIEKTLNPPLTGYLEAIIFRVVRESTSRNGNRPMGDTKRIMQMRHARDAFWGALQARPDAIRPSFVDAYGRDDYFPAEFTDPKTGYRVPCPNWEKGMNHQMEWVPTVVGYFNDTIPLGNGPLSRALREMSVEEVVILIHDGPFRTGRAEWRKLKKSGESIETMRSKARQDKRVERKVIVRSQYREEVPELTTPEHDWMFHRGMMSRDVTNFYEAVDVAEERANPNSSGRTKRRVLLIDGFIPQLETGKSAHSSIVRTAICGFRKKFRAANPQLFKMAGNLVDTSVVNPPVIFPFLEKYPKEDEGVEATASTETAFLGSKGDGDEGGDHRSPGFTTTQAEDMGWEADTEEDEKEHDKSVGKPVVAHTLAKKRGRIAV